MVQTLEEKLDEIRAKLFDIRVACYDMLRELRELEQHGKGNK